jgi:hypothetical protein
MIRSKCTEQKEKLVAWPPDWTIREHSGDWTSRRPGPVNNPQNQAGAEWDREFKAWVPPEVTGEIAESNEWHMKYSKSKASWLVENLDNQLDHHQHMVYFRGGGKQPPNETGIMTLREGRPNNAGADWDDVDGWSKARIDPQQYRKQTPLDTSLKNIGYGDVPRGRKKNNSGGTWDERTQCWMTIPNAGISTHSFLGSGELGSKSHVARRAQEKRKKKGVSGGREHAWESARTMSARTMSARSTPRKEGGKEGGKAFAPNGQHYTALIQPPSKERKDNNLCLTRFIGGIKSDQHATRTNLAKFLASQQHQTRLQRPVSASAALAGGN